MAPAGKKSPSTDKTTGSLAERAEALGEANILATPAMARVRSSRTARVAVGRDISLLMRDADEDETSGRYEVDDDSDSD